VRAGLGRVASVGLSGVAALVDRREGNARALAAGISQIDGTEVLNDVVYTQVCGSFGADSRTEAVFRELIAEGRRLDVRLSMARSRRAPHLGQQLVDG